MFEIGDHLGRRAGGVYRQSAGLGQYMKDIDGLLVGTTELGNEFGDGCSELKDTVFDQLERKGRGQCLGQRQQVKHRVRFQGHAGVAVGIALTQIDHPLAMTRDAQGRAIATSGGDICFDALRDARETGRIKS